MCTIDVAWTLEQAEATDEDEDARYSKEQRGDELPAELERRAFCSPDRRKESANLC